MPIPRRVFYCVHEKEGAKEGICIPCVIKMVAILINTTVDFQCPQTKKKCVHDCDATDGFCSLKSLELHLRSLYESIQTIDRTSFVKPLDQFHDYRNDPLWKTAILTVIDRIDSSNDEEIHKKIGSGLKDEIPIDMITAAQVLAVSKFHDFLFCECPFSSFSKSLPVHCTPFQLIQLQTRYFRRADLLIRKKSKLRCHPYRRTC